MDEESIFEQAIEKASPEERTAFLEEACAGDRELRAKVEALLRAHDHPDSFLGRPIAGDRPTDVLNALTDPEGLPDATNPPPEEISLDFLQPSDTPHSLGRLGQYEVREVVGRGGMGVVLKANDTKLNRIVAVKVLAPELASNATARTRFVREAQAVAAVSHHHVVTIYAVEEDPLPYLVMEFIDGQSLQQKIDRQGQFPLREILRIGHQIAGGLAAAHGQGIIHRDIKPANILLQNGIERVQITDFGLARAVDDVAITRTGEVAGTPQFMSPEQAQGQPVDHRSDLFSLGSVLYTMCTGRPPFRADTTVAVLRRICDDTARPIREVNPDVPEWLVEIVARLLAKQPEDRFETAAEVAELLGKHLAHVQDPGSTPFPDGLPAVRGTRTGRARRRRFWLAAAMILLAAVGSLGISEATGVTRLAATVIRIATGEGTLVVEVDDPGVSVTIDGEDLVITGAGLREVRLKPGQYRVRATKQGRVVTQELVTIQRGGRQAVRVGLEPPVTPLATDAQRLDELSKSIQANPRDAGLLEERGRLYAGLGRYDEAARDFIRANELLASPWGWDPKSGLFDSLVQHEEVFARIAELRPDDLALWGQRGNYYALRGQWERALPDYARASDRYQCEVLHAWALLMTGDEEGYRRVCGRMAARFGQTDQPDTALHMALACSAGPQSGIDPARIAGWAELSLRNGRNKFTLHALALAHYRAGQFDQAVTLLQEAIDLPKERMAKSEAAFPLALAYRGLGQEEEGRKWYQTGVAELEWIKSRKPDDPVSWGSSHWLNVNVWYREAKAVFEPTEPQGPKTEEPK
ncbi:MAG TPA: protein kinase [Thermoguttaceae bacterium]|nr:protein kinase [Thermoguttaceae bacterium]